MSTYQHAASRTVAIDLPEDWLEGAQGMVPHEQLQAAIGRLCLWAHTSPKYRHLTLRPDGRGADMIATYRDAHDGAITYCIGAIWHDTSPDDWPEGMPRQGHYGFHS